MCQEDGQGNAHNNQKPCSKPSQVNPCTRIAFNKVVWIGTSPGYPIRYWRKYIGRNDEEGKEVMEQSSGEDNEQESDGKNKGESDDCFQSRRHRGLGPEQAGRRSLSAELLKLYRLAERIVSLCEGNRKALIYD